jgi:hypothetical protein
MELSFRLKQKIDSAGGDYYIFQEDFPISIDLSRVVFLIFPADDESEDGKLVIRMKETKAPLPVPAGKEALLEEVKKAEVVMSGGYVGVGYFCLNWKAPRLPSGAEARRRLIDLLVADKRLEIYQAPDGKEAVRSLG